MLRKLARKAVIFTILSQSVPTFLAAQSVPVKDIPAIAKAANRSIVEIVMSDKDGKPLGQGSGFFVSKDGFIITNYHVIAEGVSAIAKLPNGAFYTIDRAVAFDKERDIAVIKAHGEGFRSLKLGNSDHVQVGQAVVAIGNPLSLESTVSNGIVSGIRSIEEKGKFLQITAPISPGSSGGPLFNMVGEVVGITTMYLKGGENLNFAVPINTAKHLLTDLYLCMGLPASLTPDGRPIDSDTPKVCSKKPWPNEVAQEKDATPSAPTRAAGPMTAQDHYHELRKAGEFIMRSTARHEHAICALPRNDCAAMDSHKKQSTVFP